ncbi:hypothetical protein LguiA_024899 [Lonicera macranthoides]
MMITQVVMFLLLLSLVVLIIIGYSTSGRFNNVPKCYCEQNEVRRANFPKDFVFGTASSAYQFEGAYNEDGKGLNNWDYYTHKYPERITDKSTGDVANDFYHRYKEDVATIKNMGLDAYRFSISWSRILPHGTLNGGKVNQKGIDFYNNLIDELLANGIEPYVTIFHWDVPLALEDAYGGFLDSRIVEEYHHYAEICFSEFGDRVKHWITFNEPWTFSNWGYATGELAPGRCSSWQELGCTGGDSGIEPYLVGHHQLLAHAVTVKTYRQKYQKSQKGKIGITLLSHWFLPYSNSRDDHDARKRAVDFMLGWFLHPLTYGEYPQSMRELIGSRLPSFTEEEFTALKGSFDFLGMNYYTTAYSFNAPPNEHSSYTTDARVHQTSICEKNDESLSVADACNDVVRKDYYHDHLCCLKKAISQHGVNVVGYFAWSLWDNFEWGAGYSVRFGMYYVDYENNLTRYEKYSAKWFKSILVKEIQESQPRDADL